MRHLPIPVEFRLPGPEWTVHEPDAAGIPTAAFVAMRDGVAEPLYTPVLTISGGWRTDSATVEQVGDESLAVLAEQASEVRLLERGRHGGGRAPAITQLMGASTVIDGQSVEMRQGQVVAAMVDVGNPDRAIVLLYTVTCTLDQFDVVGREFHEFMGTVRPVAPPGVPGEGV